MSMSVLITYVELCVLDFIAFNVLQGCGHGLSLSVCSALCAAIRAPIHHLTFQKWSTYFRRKNDSWLKKV